MNRRGRAVLRLADRSSFVTHAHMGSANRRGIV
jgi:hypothetical protein